MRRRVVQVVLLLFIGVVVNVGVALWCVGSASWKGRWSAPSSEPSIVWLWPERSGGKEPNTRWTSTAFGAVKIEVSREERFADKSHRTSYASLLQRTQRAGWPMHSLETRDQYPPHRVWKPRFFTKSIWMNSFEQGLCLRGQSAQGQIVLPLRPRWPGFGVNTLVFASLAWMLVAGFAGAKRTLRRRRGRCPRCNYDLKGLQTCPECGRSNTTGQS